MKRRSRTPETPASILTLCKKVEQWRATRSCRGRMPEALWSEAADLAHEHGIYAVSQGAGVAYEGIKKRVQNEVSRGHPLSRAQENAVGPFVELPMSSVSSGQAAEVAVIELRDGNGRSLSVRVMAQALSQVPELATKLWGLS